MKRAAVLLLPALLALAACARDFRVTGTITLSAALQSKAPKDNAVLFVIAKNRGGVPLAVRRIVNPHFPVSFELDGRDLLVPSIKGQQLILEVQMNTHGHLGVPRPGDLFGVHPDQVGPTERHVHVEIDRQA